MNKADIRQNRRLSVVEGRKSAIYAVRAGRQKIREGLMAKGFVGVFRKWHGLCDRREVCPTQFDKQQIPPVQEGSCFRLCICQMDDSCVIS
ncbi:hypothetical protein [Pseudomonas gingeri]|uniref:Uncharacterized protein n=1 Tax=Pseudomonas gingeri TaxID=117681 RepID=A0A7Y7Y963_9PSED|nr:hypothetical protein [Pseudomonas gingeri]NWA00639.1 hypothetical protein [Pseudomonas gingeri]NWA16318.1 hypothetical protein [Pseudomonas gingeri]NWA54507.1 hypothetical protein [Pseudomonas gingeri]NWA97415.1 hypothetical protein [Pseudomonas gingeri]NWB04222.1 hypothetical protein [Pseudomonas gingeri]